VIDFTVVVIDPVERIKAMLAMITAGAVLDACDASGGGQGKGRLDEANASLTVRCSVCVF